MLFAKIKYQWLAAYVANYHTVQNVFFKCAVNFGCCYGGLWKMDGDHTLNS